MELYDKLLFGVFSLGADEFHFVTGAPVVARVDGQVRPLGGGPLDAAALWRLLYDLCAWETLEALDHRGAVCFDLDFQMGRRFRAFALSRNGHLEMALKRIHAAGPPAESLGVPRAFVELASEGWGLFVLASPENEGAPTTTRAVLQSLKPKTIQRVIEIHDRRRFLDKYFGGRMYPAHETLGDAAVFLLARSPGSALVTGAHSLELVRAALFAAESGHMAFLRIAAPRTDAALKAISELLDTAADTQALHGTLAENLHAVLAQRMIRQKGHRHARVAAFELVARSESLDDAVRRRRWDRIEHIIAAGRRDGMIDQDESLMGLVMRGRLAPAAAIARARHPSRLAESIKAWQNGTI